ncbi:MAG: TIGR01459 family HAD-type hydrolase [Rickettsiaceae bacterium]|nr:TIGR01459 family HAD-type hydrolase [Rickettsiaceae bacterium]
MYTKIEKITTILDQYDVFIFDIWGVLHEGGGLYEGVKDFFNNLSKSKIVRIISNAPRKRSTVAGNLQSLGLTIEENHIFTSGETTRFLIANSERLLNIARPKIFHVKREINHELMSSMEHLEVGSIDHANLVLLSAYVDEGEDVSDIMNILDFAAKKNLLTLVANPDKQVKHLGAIRKCSGYFADYYESIGGSIKNAGKPESEIFEECLASIDNFDKKKAIMIGDTFHTDIKGAMNINIDSGLVLTGNMGILMQNSQILDRLDSINYICKQNAIYPTRIVSLV